MHQLLQHILLLCALTIPSSTLTMQKNSPKKPVKRAAENHLPFNTFNFYISIGLGLVTGFGITYAHPKIIDAAYDYIKKNTAQATKLALFTAWNGFVFYNLKKQATTMEYDIDPKDRIPASLCLLPASSAFAMTYFGAPSFATYPACAIAAYSIWKTNTQENIRNNKLIESAYFKQNADFLTDEAIKNDALPTLLVNNPNLEEYKNLLNKSKDELETIFTKNKHLPWFHRGFSNVYSKGLLAHTIATYQIEAEEQRRSQEILITQNLELEGFPCEKLTNSYLYFPHG